MAGGSSAICVLLYAGTLFVDESGGAVVWDFATEAFWSLGFQLDGGVTNCLGTIYRGMERKSSSLQLDDKIGRQSHGRRKDSRMIPPLICEWQYSGSETTTQPNPKRIRYTA